MVALALPDEAHFAVVETGMNVPGEIEKLAGIVEPDVAMLLNVGIAHAASVGGGRDAVGVEKGALIAALREFGTAVVNADDDVAMAQIARVRPGVRVVTFGAARDATYRFASRSGRRMGFWRPSSRSIEVVTLPSPGREFAMNTVASLAAVDALLGDAFPRDRIEAALSSLSVSGRFTIKTLGNGAVLVDDSYNADPSSFAASINTFDEISEGRRQVIVVGEMKELGQLSEQSHVELGAILATGSVDLVIGCGGPLVDLVLSEVQRLGGADVIACPDVESAAREACSAVKAEDAILVKASRSVGAERVARALTTQFGEVESPEGGR